MPLIYYRSIANAEVALWRASEPNAFFLDRLSKEGFLMAPFEKIKHQEKRRQWLASRFLLCEIYPQAIQTYRQKKPFLFNGPEISFSHSNDVVAVLISELASGIDVQVPVEKLLKIAPKFLNAGELELINAPSDLLGLSLIWCIKEAIFKTYGHSLAFKDIRVEQYDPISDLASVRVLRFGQEYRHELVVDHLDGMSLAYLIA